MTSIWKNDQERVKTDSELILKRKSSTLMEWCSCLPCNPKRWVSCHQKVALQLFGALSSSWPHSHSMSSSCLVNLFVLFGFLANPFSRNKPAVPSSTSLDPLKNLPLMQNTHNLTNVNNYQLNFILLQKKKVHNLCHLFDVLQNTI